MSGEVLLDGRDLRSLDPRWLRGRVIGYINQEPVLFATSIRENIRYGGQDATDEEVGRDEQQALIHGNHRSFFIILSKFYPSSPSAFL